MNRTVASAADASSPRAVPRDASDPSAAPRRRPSARPGRRPGAAFAWSHPAHVVALGFGSGLSPWAPGTAGTLWAWAAYALLRPGCSDAQWALVLGASATLGWWACTTTARHLRSADPGCIVWDEVLAFWLVLWLVTPASFVAQAVAFALFRCFDAAKPGPVGWADARYKGTPGALPGWRQGWGILVDDLVAALCTLIVIALWRFAWPG